MNKLHMHAPQHTATTSAPTPVETYPELADLVFYYSLKCDRYWHRLQDIKRDKK